MKHLISIIIFLLFNIQGHCQEDKRYYYKFEKKQLFQDAGFIKTQGTPLRYKAGKDLRIEIKNYNPLKHEIIIEESSSYYFLADTAKWSSRIILPTIPNAPNAAALPATTPAQLSKKMDFVAFFNNPAASTPPTPGANITSCDYVKQAQSDLNAEKDLLQQSISTYKDLIVEIEGINNSYENLKALPALNTTVVIAELRDIYLASLNSYLTSQGESSLGNNPLSLSSASLALKETIFLAYISGHLQRIQNIKVALDRISNANDCSVQYDKLYKEFRDNYDLVQKAYNDFASARNSSLSEFKKNISLYDKLKQYAIADPEMVTGAITIEKDIHTITIKTKTGSEVATKYDDIHVEPYKGFKIDVAPGFFFSTLSDRTFSKHSKDSIYQKQYVKDGMIRDTVVSESFATIYEKDNASISFGGMIFLQAHSQDPGFFNYGGYIGFGALFNDQARWCGSVGGSVLIGKKQHFNINLGFILSQVDRLSPPYKADTPYRETIDNIPTYRAWKGGFMLGASWNL